MARKNPIPTDELLICARLRQARTATMHSRVASAKLLGLDSSLLASYEHGRIPLRYAVADRCCELFDINQRWLATGVGPQKHYFPVSEKLQEDINPRLLFSNIYFDILRSHVEERHREIARLYGSEVASSGDYDPAALNNFHPMGEEPTRAAAFYMRGLINVKLAILQGELLEEYVRRLQQLDEQFCQQHDLALRATTIKLSKKEKTACNLVAVYGNKSLMQSPLAKLLCSVKRLTARRGMKKQLASMFEVPPSTISQWLSGTREPGGETTLRLLEWVQAEEEKNSGSVSTTTGAKTTRRKKKGHETTKSSTGQAKT